MEPSEFGERSISEELAESKAQIDFSDNRQLTLATFLGHTRKRSCPLENSMGESP
jgi:hypothetical protein